MRIRDPRWSKPVWGRGGEVVSVVVAGVGDGEVAFFAERGEQRVGLDVVGRSRPAAGFERSVLQLPHEIGAGLYDLRGEGAASLFEPHALAVRGRCEDTLSFAHTSDFHLLNTTDTGEFVDRSDEVREVIDRLNALRPDFVVDTGDLVNRYDGRKEKMSDELIWRQAREARELLLGLDAPLFLCPGNHDVAFESSRRAWSRHMGSPWDRETDDYSFDCGGCHIAVLDGSVYYDEITWEHTASAFTPDQLAWLREDLTAAADRRLRILFTHYDYGRRIEKLVESLRIDLFLYGHSGARGECVGLSGVCGHLAGTQGFALYRVENGAIRREDAAVTLARP